MSQGTGQPIRIWAFYDAPIYLQKLSEHGGDEDWLAVIPPELTGRYLPWLEEGSGFGVCDVSVHPHPTWDGAEVRIGAHA